MSWRPQTFTASRSGGSPVFARRAFQSTTCRQACSSTHASIPATRPVSSASGMKTSGPTAPDGRDHRASPSKPRSSPVPARTCGWYTTLNSLRSIAWRNADSMSKRSVAQARISASKISKRHPPACLARYIAVSESRSSVSAESSGPDRNARPTLAETNASTPSRSNGRSTSATMRRATSTPARASSRSSAITTNSSPPRRPTVSGVRKPSRKRCDTWISSRSPALCPRLSFTIFTRSRSM